MLPKCDIMGATSVRHILCLFVFLAGLAGSSCGKASVRDESSDGGIVVRVSENTVRSSRGLAEIALEIDDFEGLDYLRVVKDTKYGRLPARHVKSLISADFTYVYVIKETDPEELTLEFTAYDAAGNPGETVPVRIINAGAAGEGSLTLSGLQCVSRVTGDENNGHDGLPAVKYTLNNRTDKRFNVGGTDLGIVWEISPGRYGLFFGDTYGADFRPNPSAPGPNGGSWRSNVLLFSEDADLSDGMTISGAAMSGGQAKEICFGAKNTSGSGDFTSIPTAAVHAAGADYVHYMNIRTWAGWITNYSSLYKSEDAGENWTRLEKVTFGGESNFGQCGYFNDGGIVYMMGTNSGRDGVPYLARFREEDIEAQGLYEYWNGFGWTRGDESAAAPLFDDKTGELSFSYMPELDKWVLLYFNATRYEISMRSADNPVGPWSDPVQVAGGAKWPQLYGSYIHPLSMKGKTLYFIMSMWLPYNTYLMSVNLEKKQ